MSNFQPLTWELQFQLKGNGLAQSSKDLEKLRRNLELTNAAMQKMTQNAQRMERSVQSAFSSAASGNRRGLSGGNAGFGGGFLGGGGGGGRQLPIAMGGSGNTSGGGIDFQLIGKAASGAATAIAGVVYVLKEAYSALDALTERAVTAFSERQSAIRAYSLFLGSTAAAEKQYFKEASIAQKTELTFEQTNAISNRLLTAGFRNKQSNSKELDRALYNILDLVTLRPQHMRETSGNQLAELYSKVRGLGYVQEGLLNRTASRFVNSNLIREEIGKQLGLKSNKEVQDALKDRKVSADVFFAAMQKASLRQIGTGKLGEYAVGASGTLSGLLSNKEEAVTNLFRSIDPESLPGVQRYKDSIIALTETMNTSTEAGRNLQYALESLSDTGTSLRSLGLEFLSSFLESFSSSFREAEKALGITSGDQQNQWDRFRSFLKDLGKSLGYLAGQVLPRVIDNIKSWFDILIKVKGVLQPVIDGLWEFFGVLTDLGLFNFTELKNNFASLKETVENSLSKALENVKAFFNGIATMAQGLYHMAVGTVTFDKSQFDQGRAMIQGASFSAGTLTKGSLKGKGNQFAGLAKRGGSVEADQTGGTSSPEDMGGSSGRGRGGGRKRSGVLLEFNYQHPMFGYTNPLPVINVGAPEMGGGFGVPVNISPNMLSPSNAEEAFRMYIDEIHIEVRGDGQSPEVIAEKVYTKFAQNMGRLVRAPSAAVL